MGLFYDTLAFLSNEHIVMDWKHDDDNVTKRAGITNNPNSEMDEHQRDVEKRFFMHYLVLISMILIIVIATSVFLSKRKNKS